MKKYSILIGSVLIVLFAAVAGPINAAIVGLIIASLFLLWLALFALSLIASYFERAEPAVRFAWAPEPIHTREDLVKAIIILGLSIAGLVILWFVIARHPLLYPHLKDAGIL